MNKTKIEYLTHTWNPLAMRCTPVSEGCAHCWHLRMANRLAGNEAFSAEVRAAYAGDGPPVLVESRLNGPLNVKAPAIVGVQFMGDLFNEDVPDKLRYKAFKIMAAADWHIFVVLTKRADVMLEFCSSKWYRDLLHSYGLSNVWPMVSIENQRTADERIPLLLQVPGAVHGVSLEPLLSAVDLRWHLEGQTPWFGPDEDDWYYDPLGPENVLDWVIVGGESGPGARPMHQDWARGIRDQCRAAGVPFFFKQWGAWYPNAADHPGFAEMKTDARHIILEGMAFARVGKKRAGRLLDGREWNEMPGASA